MVNVIVERSFEGPADYAGLGAREDLGALCLQEHRVRGVRRWVSKDHKRVICVYEAPDAESVRIAQRKAEMPHDRVWSAAPTPVASGSQGAPSARQEYVVVERTFKEPVTEAEVAALFEKGGECMPRHRVVYFGGHFSSDGRRMLCIFLAPDAESVRIANREFGAPFDRAWTATLHEAGRG